MKILFLCVANSARSQIAEGLAKKILGDKAEVRSAGSNPSGTVNPTAIEVMREIGIDISDHSSKSWDDLPPRFFIGLDYVISLCAEEVCPNIVTKANKVRWAIPDPAAVTGAEQVEAFRGARNTIQSQIEAFLKEIT